MQEPDPQGMVHALYTAGATKSGQAVRRTVTQVEKFEGRQAEPEVDVRITTVGNAVHEVWLLVKSGFDSPEGRAGGGR